MKGESNGTVANRDASIICKKMQAVLGIKYRQRGKDPLNHKRHFFDNSYEIIHVLSGSGNVVCGDKIFPLEPGSIYFIDSEMPHMTLPEGETEYVRSKAVLQKNAVAGLLAQIGDSTTLDALFGSRGGKFFRLDSRTGETVDSLFFSMEDDPSPIHFFKNILEIFMLCKASEAAPTKAGGCGATEQLMLYISSHLASPLRLDTLSAAVHTSKYYLCREFHKKTGMTINEYIKSVRILRAKKLLETTADSVSEIALSVGFVNFSHFSSAFKSICGMPPSAYRKAAQQNR